MILPRRIYDLGLSHKAVSVYCYLCGRADKNGECYPSVGRIAEDLNLSRCTVFRAFNELEENGLLEREARTTHKADGEVHCIRSRERSLQREIEVT